MRSQLSVALAFLGAACASAALGQYLSAPSIASILPDVTSISPANAAGVLQYCVNNNLVSSSLTDTVVGQLTSKKEVVASPDYSAGQAGQILIKDGKSFSLAQASDFLKSQSCDRVLRQAQQFK